MQKLYRIAARNLIRFVKHKKTLKSSLRAAISERSSIEHSNAKSRKLKQS